MTATNGNQQKSTENETERHSVTDYAPVEITSAAPGWYAVFEDDDEPIRSLVACWARCQIRVRTYERVGSELPRLVADTGWEDDPEECEVHGLVAQDEPCLTLAVDMGNFVKYELDELRERSEQPLST